MFQGQTIFGALLDFIPKRHFEYLTQQFKANRYIKSFPAWAHFVCMAFAQLTRRHGLRDLEVVLNTKRQHLYHLGVRHRVSRSTMADAAERRDWQFFEALGQRLIADSLTLYKDDTIALGLKEPLYAMDSTTIDLCLKLFPWADFRATKAAVKAHTVIDLRGSIPVFMAITTGKVHDVNRLKSIELQPNATVVLDRGYVDFAKLHSLRSRRINFVVRAKDNMRYEVAHDMPFETGTGVQSDQSIMLTTKKASKDYPQQLRRVAFYDAKTNLHLVFLTNRYDLPALTIAQIYKERWKIELFFKWLKQNLTVKHFFGNSQNAVKAQIWIAVCVYLMVLIARKTLKLDITMQLLLHALEANMFDKMTLQELVKSARSTEPDPTLDSQLDLL
jgi:Transposase DDE domain/Domain of unknown function (DUF4372)